MNSATFQNPSPPPSILPPPTSRPPATTTLQSPGPIPVVADFTTRLTNRDFGSQNKILLESPIDAVELLGSPLPRPPELVCGLLHQGSKMVIGGGSKSFKTWVLVDLAVSVATGTDWWGFKTTKGRVLYMNFEIQDVFFRDRINDVCIAKNCALKPGQLDYWGLRGKAADLGSLMQDIIIMVKGGGYSLILFDPIYKGLGSRDENKAGDVASLLNEIESLAVETGAPLHLVTISAKATKPPKNQSTESAVQAYSRATRTQL